MKLCPQCLGRAEVSEGEGWMYLTVTGDYFVKKALCASCYWGGNEIELVSPGSPEGCLRVTDGELA